jgi:hypothetical protein
MRVPAACCKVRPHAGRDVVPGSLA